MGLSNIYNPKEGYNSAGYLIIEELNKWIVWQPYPIPKISTTLQELEGFTYAKALDPSMGYYTIRLDPMAVKSAPSYTHGVNTCI